MKMNSSNNIDTTSAGQKWWIYSKENKKFDALGFTKDGNDSQREAVEAMECLSKHLHEPIPADVELVMLGRIS